MNTQHILDWDERDSIHLPKNGHRVKVTNEVAGFGGDVFFSKLDVQSEYLKEFYKNWVRDIIKGFPKFGKGYHEAVPKQFMRFITEEVL